MSPAKKLAQEELGANAPSPTTGQVSENELAALLSAYQITKTKRANLETKPRGIGFHLVTLFLFTKSDFKTMTILQSIFAIAAVYSPSTVKCVSSFDSSTLPDLMYLLINIPLMVFWLWINCALHDIANQSLPDSVVEDSVNKPWRPIPSGRIPASHARSWLLGIVPLSLVVSHMLDALMPMTTLVVFVWMYNDLEGSSASIWVRNALNGTGLMSFGCGALAVLAGGQGHLLPKAYSWLFLTGLIVFTTVQSQDLPDLEGDKARRRQTIPIVYGEGIAGGVSQSWSYFGPLQGPGSGLPQLHLSSIGLHQLCLV